MLKGVPKILSPQLLKVLCEMGHSDRIMIADGNFPRRIHGKGCDCNPYGWTRRTGNPGCRPSGIPSGFLRGKPFSLMEVMPGG